MLENLFRLETLGRHESFSHEFSLRLCARGFSSKSHIIPGAVCCLEVRSRCKSQRSFRNAVRLLAYWYSARVLICHRMVHYYYLRPLLNVGVPSGRWLVAKTFNKTPLWRALWERPKQTEASGTRCQVKHQRFKVGWCCLLLCGCALHSIHLMWPFS